MSPTNKTEVAGTVGYTHADAPALVGSRSVMESTYNTGLTSDVPLGEYLSRPVLLATTTIAPGDTPDTTLDPWNGFLSDPNVRRRIEGFKHIRGTLCLRFMVTGNPFVMGRFMYFYIPRPLDNIVDIASQFNDARHIQASQHMHVMLDPCTGGGAEMKLPFFCPENWIDLTSTRSRHAMGRLRFYLPVGLNTTAAGTCTSTVTIHAWMEDVELAGPTASDYDVWTPQGPGWQNEFATSPISKTASALSKAAGLMEFVPELAPYAIATANALSTVSKVAHHFGFSRPQVLEHLGKYRHFVAGDMATTNTHDAFVRMGLDVKGELTVDPRTVGLDGRDEMSILNIVSKDTIFNRVTWGISDISGATLRTYRVTPCQFFTDTTTTNDRSALTPQAAIASMFEYWRGTIIYRFRIVASAMHRGRLRIRYDPTGDSYGAMNEVYSRIIDLQETRDFEIPIRWHAQENFLRVAPPAVGTTEYNHGLTMAHQPTFQNGVLTIEVLNPLTSPDDSVNVGARILVSQRMCDDAEFASPRFHGVEQGWRLFSANIGEGLQGPIPEPDEGNEPSGSAEIVTQEIGTTAIPHADHTMKVFFGESVKSLRTLMKRYYWKHFLSSTATHSQRVRPDKNHLLRELEYIMWMFVGWRGSLRYKFVAHSEHIMFLIKHRGLPAPAIDVGSTTGSHLNRQVVEWEMPFYSNKRFAPARGGPSFSDYESDTYDANDPNDVWFTLRSAVGTTSATTFHAVGEDFALFWHVGLPLLYAA